MPDATATAGAPAEVRDSRRRPVLRWNAGGLLHASENHAPDHPPASLIARPIRTIRVIRDEPPAHPRELPQSHLRSAGKPPRSPRRRGLSPPPPLSLPRKHQRFAPREPSRTMIRCVAIKAGAISTSVGISTGNVGDERVKSGGRPSIHCADDRCGAWIDGADCLRVVFILSTR